MHPLHVLTPLTGKEAAEKRTVVIGTVELNWRLFVVLASASVPALILTAFTWPFLSQYAILVFPIVLMAASMLFYKRSNKGMRLRTYQTFLDKKRARDVGQFYLCGEPIDIAPTHFKNLLHNTVPYRTEERQNGPQVVTNAVLSKRDRRGDGHTFNGSAGADDDEMVGTRSLRSLAPRRRHHAGEDVVVPPSLPKIPAAVPILSTNRPTATAVLERPADPTPAVSTPSTQPNQPTAPVGSVAPVAPPAVTQQPPAEQTPQLPIGPAPQPAPVAPAVPATTREPVPTAPAAPVQAAPDALSDRTPAGDYDHDDIDPAVFFDSSAPGRRKRA